MAKLNSERLRSRFLYDFASDVYGAVTESDEFSDAVKFECLGDVVALAKPAKFSALHHFIKSVIWSRLDYLTGHFAEEGVEYFAHILRECDKDVPGWLNSDDISLRIRQLDDALSEAVDSVLPSVFFLLFSDRAFLIKLQKLIARYVAGLAAADHPRFFQRDGIFKRTRSLPSWLKEAIFYRDKGHCQLCWTNLTGLLMPTRNVHLDHMIPLACSGSNDVTNFQLTCKYCNCKKGRREITTEPRFIAYW